jgi:hypothetical protein
MGLPSNSSPAPLYVVGLCRVSTVEQGRRL